ncbi:endonuclease domain-containing protein [Bauldia sp.]|uniref:endonuclease domain-containing protein n=1 Tax=Bauldia sp. TaxID=2575872 RepID=UPI003BA8EC2F
MANQRARYLRKTMTPQEVKLWVHLRTWRTIGIHFRRQAPVNGQVVDFLCRRSRLVVEIDGSGHARHRQAAIDRSRDKILAAAGYRVIRFWNRNVDTNLQGVLDTIRIAVENAANPTRPALRAGHPPQIGEG